MSIASGGTRPPGGEPVRPFANDGLPPRDRTVELAERLIAEARATGYREMRLDVQAKFLAARQLYADLGFVAADPVSFNPVPGASFLGLQL